MEGWLAWIHFSLYYFPYFQRQCKSIKSMAQFKLETRRENIFLLFFYTHYLAESLSWYSLLLQKHSWTPRSDHKRFIATSKSSENGSVSCIRWTTSKTILASLYNENFHTKHEMEMEKKNYVYVNVPNNLDNTLLKSTCGKVRWSRGRKEKWFNIYCQRRRGRATTTGIFVMKLKFQESISVWRRHSPRARYFQMRYLNLASLLRLRPAIE